MRQLSQEEINGFSVQIAQGVETANLLDLYTNPRTQAEIHMAAIITKDAMVNDDVVEMQRFVPDEDQWGLPSGE